MPSSAATSESPSDVSDTTTVRYLPRPRGSARVIAGASVGSRARSLDPVAPLDRSVDERAAPHLDVVGGHLQVRLAASPGDIDAVQALRYRIFYETMGAQPLAGMA